MGIYNKIIKNVAVPVLSRIQSSNKMSTDIENIIEKHQVMPDVIKDPPPKFCDVQWATAKACLGNVIEPWRLLEQPRVRWNSAPDKYYTLLMLDLDMPHRSKPSMKYFLHWMVTNIRGPDVSSGKSIVDYVAPAPPEHTGLHRITFMVYLQKELEEFKEKHIHRKMGRERGSFNLDAFIKRYELFGPLGVNYIMVEYDTEVYDLLKMMGLLHLNMKKPVSSGRSC